MKKYQNDILVYAMQSIQHGNFSRAKSLLNESLKTSTKKSEVYRLLGVIDALSGNQKNAINQFEKAISLDKNNSMAIANLGNVLKELGKYDQAVDKYQEALKIKADPETYYNLGLLYQETNNDNLAMIAYQDSLKLNKNFIDSIINLSILYFKQRAYKKALELLIYVDQSVLENLSVLINKGFALNELGCYTEAIECLKKCLKIDSNNPKVLSNLGTAYLGIKNYDESLKYYEQALIFDNNSAQIYSNLGHLYQKLKNYPKSIELSKKAISIDSNFSNALVNIGVSYLEQKDFFNAKEALNTAIQIDINNADAHLNLAHVELHLFNYRSAWEHYEWRWRSKLHKSEILNFSSNFWNGQACNELIIWTEQGIGDFILFSQIFEDVIETVSKVNVLIDDRLSEIYSRTYPEINFITKTKLDPDKQFEFQIPIGSLGKIFRNNMHDFDKRLSSRNLTGNIDLINEIKPKINKISRNKSKICGISWTSTNLNLGDDKSLNLRNLTNVLNFADHVYIDLQYVDSEYERKTLLEVTGLTIHKFDEIDSFNDLERVFSLISLCDYVITVSNSVAHMAAALGKPVYLLLPYGAGKFWYWQSHLGKNLWYKNVVTYEQIRQGDWTVPIENLKQDLIRIWN